MKSIFLLLLGLFLLFSFSAAAQTPIPLTAEKRAQRVQALEKKYEKAQDHDILRRLALTYSVHAALDLDSKEHVEKGLKYMEAAEKIFPKDPELEAAFGSLLTVMAKFESSGTKQLLWTKKGTRKMDRAIKLSPENLGARLYRGNNSLNLPLFLNRTHLAVDDFKKLLEESGEDVGVEYNGMLLFSLGRAYSLLKQEEEAEKYWKKAAELSCSTHWQELARQKL